VYIRNISQADLQKVLANKIKRDSGLYRRSWTSLSTIFISAQRLSERTVVWRLDDPYARGAKCTDFHFGRDNEIAAERVRTAWAHRHTVAFSGPHKQNFGLITCKWLKNPLWLHPNKSYWFTLCFFTTHCSFKAYCAIWVRCSNFHHQASLRVSPRESTQRRKVELWAKNVLYFCLNAEFHVTFRDLLHAVKLRHGTDGFTSPLKEGVLRIFFAPKILTAWAGCEPANLDTKDQHATSRPPKPPIELLTLVRYFNWQLKFAIYSRLVCRINARRSSARPHTRRSKRRCVTNEDCQIK